MIPPLQDFEDTEEMEAVGHEARPYEEGVQEDALIKVGQVPQGPEHLPHMASS